MNFFHILLDLIHVTFHSKIKKYKITFFFAHMMMAFLNIKSFPNFANDRKVLQGVVSADFSS